MLCRGKLYECKALLDSQVLFIYLFLFQYFTCDCAKPDRGDTERGREKKEKREMIGEDNEKEDETKQLAAIPVESKQKTSYGLCGETRWRTIRNTARRQTERGKKQKKAQAVTTPAANTYNITVDGLKPQDDTTTM